MIVITGTSSGLGASVAKLYLSQGKKVVGLSKSQSIDGVHHVQVDLRQTEEIKHAVKQILSTEEPIEAIINCAGIMSIKNLNSIEPTKLNDIFKVNVIGHIELISGLIDKIKADGGDIVNVASTVGTKAYEDQAGYGASKWAMRGFSVNLQLELKGFHCRVISFCPGGFKTKMFEKATGVDNTDSGSWMNVDDVAKALKATLDLPKNMEVSEIVINRK